MATNNDMGIADKLIAYPLATVFQLSFHLILALPWLLLTWLLSVVTRGRLASRARFFLLSGVAAAGLAPQYGHHLSMVPAYLGFFGCGEDNPLYVTGYFAVSWAVTWCVILLVAHYRVIRKRKSLKKIEGKT